MLVDGPVSDAPGESWPTLCLALQKGYRGLKGGITLRKLLVQYHGAGPRNLTPKQILTWADTYQRRTGKWPITTSGPVKETSWCAIDRALRYGGRGLSGGSSLGALLGKSVVIVPYFQGDRRDQRKHATPRRPFFRRAKSRQRADGPKLRRRPARKVQSAPCRRDFLFHSVGLGLKFTSRAASHRAAQRPQIR